MSVKLCNVSNMFIILDYMCRFEGEILVAVNLTVDFSVL